MTMRHDSPARPRALEGGRLGAFTLETIRPVRDFTARKTLEQAHAFAVGLADIARAAEHDAEARRMLGELESVGISALDVERTANEALALIELMAERDRKADLFHAAVRAAGQAERTMYERLASVGRLLRVKLGDRSPALACFGVPVDAEEARRVKSARPTTPAPAAKAVGT
jgi:hypothetical protein